MRMKFELAPKGQRILDKDLLTDLRRVAKGLGKITLTKREYLRRGKYNQQTVAKRFGGWLHALIRAGLSANRPSAFSCQDCSTDLKRVAAELGKESVSIAEYRRLGRLSERPFIRNFGTWGKALSASGLHPSANFHARVSDEQYFENLERIWIALGRQPRYSEIAKPLSAHSAHAYENRFGSWRKALEAFILFVQKDEPAESARSEIPPAVHNEVHHSLAEKLPRTARTRRTPRQPSLRLRFLVMRKDNFTCKYCGRSPALYPGLVLQVDHKTSREQGGETILADLQTLCDECNIGKSNLSSHECSED